MFDNTSRGLAVAWVLFEGWSKKDAARRLGCNRATVSGWIKAYLDSDEWWPDPVIRNRHADNVLYDTHFLRAVDAVLRSDPEQFIGEIKDVFTFLYTLPGYRDEYKSSIATLDKVLHAIGFSYKKLYRMCRERDQLRREEFARILLAIPARCLVSVDETHNDGGDLRRRKGRWLRGQRYECLSRSSKGMLRISTMMAVCSESGVLHAVTTPTPPAQNSDDWVIFLNGLLPAMKQFVPGLLWVMQESRCVLLYDNAPIHTAAVDAFIRACGVFPLRLPPYSPEFQPIEEVLSEYSFALKSAHHHYPGIPDAFLHAVVIFSLDTDNIASHFTHSLMEAARNVPELGRPEGAFAEAFEPLPVERE